MMSFYEFLYSANLSPFFSHLKSLLHMWKTFRLSWLGTIVAVKMTLLPRPLYPLQVLPVMIPFHMLRILQREVNKFIWDYRRLRLGVVVMYRQG